MAKSSQLRRRKGRLHIPKLDPYLDGPLIKVLFVLEYTDFACAINLAHIVGERPADFLNQLIQFRLPMFADLLDFVLEFIKRMLALFCLRFQAFDLSLALLILFDHTAVTLMHEFKPSFLAGDLVFHLLPGSLGWYRVEEGVERGIFRGHELLAYSKDPSGVVASLLSRPLQFFNLFTFVVQEKLYRAVTLDEGLDLGGCFNLHDLGGIQVVVSLPKSFDSTLTCALVEKLDIPMR